MNAAVPDPKIFFWIVASATETAFANPNGIKTLLDNGVYTFFINGKTAAIDNTDDPRKLENPPSCLIVFPTVPFNKIPLFSKDLLSFIISFTSLFVSVSPELLVLKVLF